jgi:hypothetical protein
VTGYRQPKLPSRANSRGDTESCMTATTVGPVIQMAVMQMAVIQMALIQIMLTGARSHISDGSHTSSVCQLDRYSSVQNAVSPARRLKFSHRPFVGSWSAKN